MSLWPSQVARLLGYLGVQRIGAPSPGSHPCPPAPILTKLLTWTLTYSALAELPEISLVCAALWPHPKASMTLHDMYLGSCSTEPQHKGLVVLRSCLGHMPTWVTCQLNRVPYSLIHLMLSLLAQHGAQSQHLGLCGF